MKKEKLRGLNWIHLCLEAFNLEIVTCIKFLLTAFAGSEIMYDGC